MVTEVSRVKRYGIIVPSLTSHRLNDVHCIAVIRKYIFEITPEEYMEINSRELSIAGIYTHLTRV